MGTKIFFTILSTLVVVTMSTDSELQIVKSNGHFSSQLYNTLSKQPGNVFFSPLSAHTVLSLSYLGSSGTTKGAYVKSLALPDKNATAEGYKVVSSGLANEKNVELYLANKIYVANDVKLKQQFLESAKENFNAEVENVNFAANTEAANTINSWVEQKTVHKIKDIFSPNDLNQDTQVVLVNAIYFKGAWNKMFRPQATRTEPFYLNANDKIDVQMMHLYEEPFGYKDDKTLNAQILEMPFQNRKFSMVIILPREKDGINDLEAKLQNVDLTKITEGVQEHGVTVALPKFKIETKIDLGDALDKMGLGEIFSNGADFSDLLEGGRAVKVDKVIQKAFIEVNEQGAEAAAATGMVLMARSREMPLKKEDFIVDHPFILLIIASGNNYAEKNVMFMGKILRI